MSDIEELYSKVSDIYSEDEFREKIEGKRSKYEDFFTEKVLAKLVVAEEGRNEKAVDDIEKIEPGEEATVEGEIIDLGTLREFENDNGKGKVRNVRIDDRTGSTKVVFWNEETERVENEFERGDTLRVVNGYVQDKGYGKQISAGKWGEVHLLEENEKD